MNRILKFIIAVIVVMCLLSFNACDFTNSEYISHSEDKINEHITTRTIYSEDASYFISFSIPNLKINSGQDFEMINDLIYKQVESFILTFDTYELYISDIGVDSQNKKPDMYDFTLIGDYQISLFSEDILSVVFQGYWNIKTEPHPNNFAFTLNIDLINNEVLDLTSIYDFNEDFIDLLVLNKDQWILNTSDEGVIEYIDYEIIKQGFEDKSVELYYTEDNIGLIINGLPFVIGNYRIIEVPRNEVPLRNPIA